MTEEVLLQQLPTLAFQAVLLFARLGATAMLLPGLGEQEVPATLRLGLGLALVPLLLPVLAPALPPVPDAVAEAARLVALECVVGLWLGGLARIAALALPCHLYFANQETLSVGLPLARRASFQRWLVAAMIASVVLGFATTIGSLRIGARAFERMEF